MRSITPTSRGMALIMAMIVIVLITMLVAGAISFTGTELAASEVQTQEASMSACVQAARNLFLAQLELKPPSGPCPWGGTDTCLQLVVNADLRGTQLTTGHLGELEIQSARQSGALKDPMKAQGDDSFFTGKKSSGPAYYIVTAVCRDNTDLNIPPERRAEREIEFMVRTDL
jgi:hypothetical protein